MVVEGVDHFDQLLDSLLLLVFNKIGDVKALGRCSAVSKRFQTLVSQVENVVVRVDCVYSDDDSSSASDKSRGSVSRLFRIALGQFSSPKRSSSPSAGGVTNHSPTQVLKNFSKMRFLKIELPSGELDVEDGVLLKWRADFGSTLDNCVMLSASSVSAKGNDDNDSITESLYTDGRLKLRVVWMISSLIAASTRHFLLQPIISQHKTLDSLVLTDADGQGMFCMDREQLEELRVKPLSASFALKRNFHTDLNMRLWHARHLELPDGSVLKGATLVAARPSEQSVQKEASDGLWISSAFEEPFGTAARMLLKRRTYCLE